MLIIPEKKKEVFMKYLFYLAIILTIAYLIKNKIKINIPSFFHKGFKPNRGIFGVYCYCGKQGSGKTYSCVEFINKNKNMRIYSNLKSIKNINYIYINGLKELLELRKEHDCIIFFDEIFTEITKNDKLSKDVLDFLCQMRKRKILFITTAQEWGELPLTLRRYCRFQIDCSLIRLPFLNGLCIKRVYDAEQMKWSSDDNDWLAPIIGTLVSHTQLRLANSYDTFEQIGFNSTAYESKVELKDNNVSRETLSNDIDNDFWGKGESLQSLCGVPKSDCNVNAKNV